MVLAQLYKVNWVNIRNNCSLRGSFLKIVGKTEVHKGYNNEVSESVSITHKSLPQSILWGCLTYFLRVPPKYRTELLRALPRQAAISMTWYKVTNERNLPRQSTCYNNGSVAKDAQRARWPWERLILRSSCSLSELPSAFCLRQLSLLQQPGLMRDGVGITRNHLRFRGWLWRKCLLMFLAG